MPGIGPSATVRILQTSSPAAKIEIRGEAARRAATESRLDRAQSWHASWRRV